MPFIEVVANTTKHDKPGWAYVPDTGFDATKAPIQPGARKRTARHLDGGESGLPARQSAALLRRLNDLGKDNSRDITVPLPSRQRAKPKNAATRKIVESQRSFAHFLADEEALGHMETDNSQVKPRIVRTKSAMQSVRHEQDEPVLSCLERRSGNVSATSKAHNTHVARLGWTGQSLVSNDANLLQVISPQMPSESLMDSLTSALPLPWSEAKTKPPSLARLPRRFCELCGYWGRIKCLHCGVRICGLSCKKAHDDGRCQKYGA